MSNITPYFSHAQNARNTPGMLNIRMKYGAEGYGIYFMILERLREDENYMSVTDYNVIAFDLRVDASKVKAIVNDFGLFVFTEDGKYFYSEILNENMEIKDDIKKKRSEAGKKGAKKRWEKNNEEDTEHDNKINDKDMANAIAKNSNAIAKPQNNIARKEEKRKEEKSILKLQELVTMYESCGFGQINYIISQKLQVMTETYSGNWIKEAFEIAVSANKYRLDYVNGILENWRRNGKSNTKNKNTKATKFHNFKQITDNYSEEELEDIAMQKQQEGFKKLGVDI